MRPGKSQNSVGAGQGRNQIQNRASSHLPNENQLRSQAYPVQSLQNLMMQQPRAAYMTGPPMPIPQRTMRPNHRGPMYSSSPQGTTMAQHYGLAQQQQQQQQNMTYAGMMHQDQYQMLHQRQYVVPAGHYQLPPTTSYTQYVQQAPPQYYNPNVPVNHPMYYVQQQTAQPQQAQQQNTGNNPSIQNNNMNKPSSKTKSRPKIVIRDPKDNKDVTDEILKSHAANHTTGANGKQSGTPPLSTSSAAQTESSSIQATFAAQVAAAVGDGKRPNNKRQEPADMIEKVEQRQILKPEPLEQNQVAEETLHVADISKKETGQRYSVLSKTDNSDAINTVTKATSLHETKTDLMNKVEILSNEKRTEILKRNNQELMSSGLAKTESKVEKILSHKDVDQVNTANTEQEQVIPSVADKEPEIRNGVTEINNEPIDKDLDVREVNPHSTNSVTEESRSEALIKDVNNGETAVTDDLKLSKNNVSTGADNNIGSNNVDVTLDHNSPNDKQKEVTPEESKDAVESEHVFVDVDKDTQLLPSTTPSSQQQAQQQQEPRHEEPQQEEPQEQHQEQQPEQQQQQQEEPQEQQQEQQPEQQQQQQPKQQQQQQEEPQEQQQEQQLEQQQQPKQQQQQEEPQEQPKQQQQQEEPQEQPEQQQQEEPQEQPKQQQQQQQQEEPQEQPEQQQQEEPQEQPKQQQQQQQEEPQEQPEQQQQEEPQEQPKQQQQQQQQQEEPQEQPEQQQQEEPQEQQQPEQQQQQQPKEQQEQQQQQPKDQQEQQQQTEQQQQQQQQQPKEQEQQQQQPKDQQEQQQQTEQQQQQQQQQQPKEQEQQQQPKEQQQQQQPKEQQQEQQQQTEQQQQQQQDQQQQQQEQRQQQQQKTGEQPKKKSSKQRIREMNKKESDGSLMDAYMDKPAPAPEPVVQEKVKDPEVIAKKVEKPLDEDLSWEDKGEKIGDEITIEKESETEATEQTKLKYERDFLLQFQFMQVCTEKPAGLPDIEVVLDAPVPPSKMNVPRSGMPDFLPSYARQKSQGGGGGRRDSRGKTQPRKIITPVHQAPVELKKSENRWTRAQKKEQELTEEEKNTAELYRVVVAILNKLTPQKFKTLVERIMQLNIDTPERLEGVIDRIFEKAISEPVFSVAYANMCRCLFPIKVSSPDEKDVTFRKLLLNRCQKEFEKEKEDEKAFLEKQSQLEELLEDEKKKIKKEEIDEEAGKNKRRMLGNIKFIGELFKLKLLTENIMHDCIFKLLRAGDEESLESMCKLLFTIGKDLDSEKAKPRIEQYFEQINKTISGKKVSSRVCFMLRDVVDLRKNNWIPRREENYNPKTIDQIHKEAQQERSQEQRNANNAKEAAKQKQKGGGRDSPKPNATSGDGWMVSGRSGKPVAIDPNKLKSMAGKKSIPDEKISLGPSGRSLGGFGQWGRGSTGGVTGTSSSQQEQESQGNRFSALSGGDTMPPPNRPYDPRRSSAPGRPSSAGRASEKKPTRNEDREKAIEAARAIGKPPVIAKTEIPQTTSNNVQDKTEVEIMKPTKEDIPQEKEPLSEEEIIKKTKAIVDEFANIEDLEEACRCFTDLHTPELHYVFVATAIEHTYEMDAKARKVTGRLLNTLLTNLLNKEQFRMGLNNALGNAEDNALDYPKLWSYLAEIITPVIIGGHFSLSDLKPLIIMHVVQYNKAAVFLAEILTLVEKEYDKNKAILVWTDSNIRWSEVLPNDITADEFLTQKNLTFLPSEVDELKKLLSEGTVTNDAVFVCIEKNFKEEKRKERPFISHLASVVAESCLTEKDSEHGLDCCVEKLKARKNILHKYLDNNHDLELEVLFALQALYVRHNKPSKMLSSFFNTLYDEEVITEDSFLAWKSDENPERQEAKGPALQATASFFEWLQSAAVEGNELN